jgi:periplasmic divalent cation tolerance protein
MKTTDAQAAGVLARVRELHPYDVPEVLFLPVTIGFDAYMTWVRDSVVSTQDSKDDRNQ